MIYECKIEVRGYELDSFGHVNNSVYLNYLEQARWEIFKSKNLFDFFNSNAFRLVVIENNIRYVNEAKIFDELVVKTELSLEKPYLVFAQDVYNIKLDKKITKANVKTLLVDKNNIPHDIPDEFLL